jgi:hypothetical protein
MRCPRCDTKKVATAVLADQMSTVPAQPLSCEHRIAWQIETRDYMSPIICDCRLSESKVMPNYIGMDNEMKQPIPQRPPTSMTAGSLEMEGAVLPLPEASCIRLIFSPWHHFNPQTSKTPTRSARRLQQSGKMCSSDRCLLDLPPREVHMQLAFYGCYLAILNMRSLALLALGSLSA